MKKQNENIKILRPTDLYVKLSKYRIYGSSGGLCVGFETFKNKYTWGVGTCTDWTGHPTSGKSQIVLEFAMNVSIKHGVKHLLYMPDVGSNEEIVADLIHKYTGKTFDKRYPNHITENEMAEGLNWVTDHFLILEQNDLFSHLTPLEVWKKGIELKETDNITSVIIDSWKDLYHNIVEFGREDIYLAHTLKTRNKLAERHQMHFHTVVHPTKPRTDGNGNPLPPTAYDLKGGSEWFNNAKTIIAVNRPDKDNNIAEIDIRKIKPRSLGKTGKYFLHFDMPKFRYYEEINGQRCFAFEHKNIELKPEHHPDRFIEPENETDIDELPF